MKYKDGMISVVEEGEEVNITPKDRNSVEVIPHAVVFHDDGIYRVNVGNKRIVITKVEQRLCEDCVSRAEALKHSHIEYDDDGESHRVVYVEDIESLPSVTPKPIMGRWIKTFKAVMGEGYMWYCDKCEYQVYQDNLRPYPSEKYCPNCGARMVEPIGK